MDDRTLNDLDFQKVLEIISGFAGSIYGKERVYALRPYDDPETVRDVFKKTGQCRRLLSESKSFRIPALPDIRPVLEKSKPAGSVAAPDEIQDTATVLEACARMRKNLQEQKENAPDLFTLIEDTDGFEDFVREVKRCVEPNGEIKDRASPQLAKLRKEQKSVRNSIIHKLEGTLRGLDRKAVEDEVITLRDNRYVIALRENYRGSVKGIVLDYSNTRTTVYIEPVSVVEMNNRLKELGLREQTEIERVLRALTAVITENHYEIADQISILGELDRLFAGAAFGIRIDGTDPEWSKSGEHVLNEARHILLELPEKKGKKKAVPQSLHIQAGIRGILITGPNAGGKTVCLKMTGLIQLMAQSGIPIPAKDGTVLRFYRKIFTDIGDTQSIENSLSTFSSRIQHLDRIIRDSDESTMVLVDELGTGTDPDEGASIGMALLDVLSERKSFYMATTHLNGLKIYGEEHDDVLNVSMEFNEKTYTPTFRLREGIPGRSFAYEIAEHLGVDPAIVTRARGYHKKDAYDFEQALSDVHQRLGTMEKREQDLAEKQAALLEKEKKLQSQAEQSAQKQAAFEKKMLREKQAYYEDLKKRFLDELRQVKEKESSAQGHRFLSAMQQERKDLDRMVQSKSKAAARRYQKGETVTLMGSRMKGEVLQELEDNKLLVSLGGKKVTVSADEVEPAEKDKKKQVASFFYDIEQTASPQCDLRGMKCEEALEALERYLDSVKLAGLKRVIIIHGKGTGVLRKETAAFLKKFPGVKNFGLADMHEGGAGATVVEL